MDPIVERISEIGIVPVIAIDDPKDAEPLAEALCRGGLPCAEVTFRTAAAEESIRIMTEKFPDMLVGAGTILTAEQADRAAAAGAKFVVSPGFNRNVVTHCISKNIRMIPGTATPGEVEQALELGLTEVKFFPSEALGGLAVIKALRGPYSSVRFMPTGGINTENMNDYLAYDRIIACGGSWMVKKELISEGRFDEIERITRAAVKKMLGFEIDHIAVSGNGENTELLGSVLGLDTETRNDGIMADGILELLGDKDEAHIAIGTNSMKRAVYHLERQGIAFDHENAVYDEKGSLKTLYLKDRLCGHRVCLVTKSRKG